MLMAALLIIPACNKDDDKDKTETKKVENVNSVAVTKFSLQADKDILPGLDSVYFSIDLKNKVIFNADSLPKGTDIRKLRTTVTFYNSISDATYTMEDGKHRTGTSNYRTVPNDTIDFTGKVWLRVVSADGSCSMNYRVKVNVHQAEPDSLVWSETSVGTLPSRLGAPSGQKTVESKGQVSCFIHESDGTYTFSRTDDPAGEWTRTQVTPPFQPVLSTLATTSDGKFYILSAEGALYTSADGLSWNQTGEKWSNIIGAYGIRVLGMAMRDGRLRHTAYPAISGYSEPEVEDGFPVSDFSNFVTISNRWAQLPTGFLIGGRTASGEVASGTWAFDGDGWTELSQQSVTELCGASVVPYYMYRNLSGKRTEFGVWMLIGGRFADGTFNRDTYISYDNGVHWAKAPALMQLPPYIPAMTGCDAVVAFQTKTATLRGWVDMPATQIPAWYRISSSVNGDTITWECPYIYLIGGFGESGALYDTIWRGAINRLTFVPLI